MSPEMIKQAEEAIIKKEKNFRVNKGAKNALIIDYLAIAKEFIEFQPIHYDTGKNWWLWDFQESRWVMTDETDLLNAIDTELEISNSVSPGSKASILEGLRRVGRKQTPKPVKDTWVQFKNTIIDIETGEKHEVTPDYFTCNPIPWELGDSEETPVIDKLFTEWVGKEHKETLYDIIAYCISPTYFIHIVIFLLGGGSNGKSVFLNLVRKFVGDFNCASTDLDSLLERFGTAPLYKKLVCLMGETELTTLRKTAKLKQLSGQDFVHFEFKGKMPIYGQNYAKLLIATNNLPTTTDRTKGYYRRMMIVDFPNTFDNKGEILSRIPVEEFSNLANKCVSRLKELYTNRIFSNALNVEEMTERYEEKSNPLAHFIEEHTRESHEGFIYKYELLEQYQAWCLKNGHRKWTATEVASHCNELGWENAQKGDKRWWAWVGVIWKGEEPNSEAEEEQKKLDYNVTGECHICGDASEENCYHPVSGKPTCKECLKGLEGVKVNDRTR